MQLELYVATGKVAEHETMVGVLEELWGRGEAGMAAADEDEEIGLKPVGRLDFIAKCLVHLESAGPGATREVAALKLKEMVGSLEAQVASGLDKLPRHEALAAMVRIRALNQKLAQDPDQKEKMRGLLEDFLGNLAAEDDEDEEDEEEESEEDDEEGSDAMESSEEAEVPPPARPSRTRRGRIL